VRRTKFFALQPADRDSGDYRALL